MIVHRRDGVKTGVASWDAEVGQWGWGRRTVGSKPRTGQSRAVALQEPGRGGEGVGPGCGAHGCPGRGGGSRPGPRVPRERAIHSRDVACLLPLPSEAASRPAAGEQHVEGV